MPAGAYSLRCVPFTREDFVRCVLAAIPDSPLPRDYVPDQVRYLSSYLALHESRPRTMLIEHPYTDRHYLEEYSGYYATALNPPSPKTTRIHIFSESWDDTAVDNLLRRAAAGERDSIQRQVQDGYLGYVVVRPIAAAPIGRTVLRPYFSAATPRNYAPAETSHDSHVAGLRLRVPAVPFQQQDQGVGACATTALWSAISRTSRADGGRAPTPLAITLAANRHAITDRILPAEAGLDLGQMLEAIRGSGFSPWVLKSNGEFDLFKMVLKCCLRSGIPVLLQLKFQDDPQTHAVTVVGYREVDGTDLTDLTPDIAIGFQNSMKLRSQGISRIYVHDDRLGPYARYIWSDQANSFEMPMLRFHPREPGFEKFTNPAEVWNAMVPLYPKLRLTPSDLVELASQLLPFMRDLAGTAKRDLLKVDLWFSHGGNYLADLLGANLPPARACELVRSLSLPRYVGIIRFSLPEGWLVDVLCDTTDIKRLYPSPWLAAIPRNAEDLPDIRQFFEGCIVG